MNNRVPIVKCNLSLFIHTKKKIVTLLRTQHHTFRMTRSKVFTYPLDHLPPSSYTSLFTLSSTTSVRSPPTSGGSTASDRCHRTRVHSLKAASNRRRNSQLFRRPDEEEDEAKHFTVRSWQDMAKSKSGRSSLSRDQLTRRSTADGSASSTIEPFFVARRSIDSNRRSNSVDSATNSSGSSTSNHRLIVSCSPHFSPTDTASSSLACIPNRKRSCTDRLFLLLLAVALTVSGISLFNTVFVQRVNVQFVLSGHDDWGNICGQTNEPIEGALWSGQNMTTRRYMLLRLGRNHSINSICIENCAFNDYFKTAFNRCLPKPLLLRPMFAMFNMTTGMLEQVLMDSLLCIDEIINLCVWSILMSFVLLVLLRFFVAFIVWLSIFMAGTLLTLFTFYFWSNWAIESGKYRDMSLTTRNAKKFEHFNELSIENWLFFAISSSILTILFFSTILWARKSIQFVTSLFKEAGKATSSMPFLLLYPFLTLSVLIMAFSYLVVSTIYTEASVHPQVMVNSTMVHFDPDRTAQYLKWYNVILFVWIAHLIYACQHYVIASSVARWYLSKDRITCCPVLCSIYELLRYHLGSLALGSLMITGIKLFRIFLKKLESIFKKYEQSNSICSRLVRIVMWLIERLMIYINKNAYILIAIYGTNFRKSAKGAFQFIMCNSLRLALINSLCDFLLLIGKLVIVAITFLIGIEKTRAKHEKLNFVWGPLVLPVVFAYLVAHCFLTVYEMAIDTLFVCRCEINGPDEIENQWATTAQPNLQTKQSKSRH